MKFCRSALWVLILLTFTTGSESDVPAVRVKLHDSAVLPCSERCPGVVRWTTFHKSSDVLAECDQTSCRSVKEGYQMIHDQYLKGDLSLIITGADFRKRGWYTCDCDDKDLCDVTLKIEAVITPVQIQPGKALLLDVDVSEPVEVVYNSTGAADGSSGQICSVEGRSLHCRPEYSQRVSLLSAVELRGMEESDGGVYTVRDTRNKEDIYVYTVSVRDGGDGSEAPGQVHKFSRSYCSASRSEFDCPPCEGAGVPVWVLVLLVVLLVAALVVVLVGAVVIVRLKREIQQLLKGSESNGVQTNGLTSISERERLSVQSERPV